MSRNWLHDLPPLGASLLMNGFDLTACLELNLFYFLFLFLFFISYPLSGSIRGIVGARGDTI